MDDPIIGIGIVLALSIIIAFVCGYSYAADTYKQKLMKARSLLNHYMKFI